MKTRMRDLGRRGIALPVALVGLVAVSLLVTTAMLTSSSEYAISSAHSAGTRSLYAAENGMQQYIQQVAIGPVTPELLSPGTQRTLTVPVSSFPATTARVRISTDLLRQVGTGTEALTMTYAVTAQPLGNNNAPLGRAVIAMLRVHRPISDPLQTNITSAITLGGDLHVNGNAFTVNGRFSGCGVTGGVDAVQSSSDSDITTNHANHWDNFLGSKNGSNTSGTSAVNKTTMTKDELAASVLGGASLDGLVNSVPEHRRWGPKFNRPAWSGFLHDSIGLAVVDANGGTIDVDGGKGVLIVINGNIRMRGNAKFEGIIIVEGNFDLAGTPTVQGALISLANDANNLIDLDDSALGAGHITVQYDKCQIDAAQQAFNQGAIPPNPTLSSSSFAWVEVVR